MPEFLAEIREEILSSLPLVLMPPKVLGLGEGQEQEGRPGPLHQAGG